MQEGGAGSRRAGPGQAGQAQQKRGPEAPGFRSKAQSVQSRASSKAHAQRPSRPTAAPVNQWLSIFRRKPVGIDFSDFKGDASKTKGLA